MTTTTITKAAKTETKPAATPEPAANNPLRYLGLVPLLEHITPAKRR